jgi:hypothetical protein
MKWKTILLTALFALGMGLEKSSAVQSFLLSINDSDPSAVTITATGLSPLVNDTGRTANDGVDLLGFFSQDEIDMPAGQFLPNSTLEGGNLTLSYNDVWSDDYSTGGGSFLDLSLYVDIDTSGSSDPESFSTTQPAFSGSWTINLSDLGINSSALPTPGSAGRILSGVSSNPGSVIGEWQVAAVPEPTTGSLLVLGSVIGLVFRRRRTA